jgi:hypothetical protein
LATEEGESGSPRAKKMLSIFGERVSEKGRPALEETGSDRSGRARKEGRRLRRVTWRPRRASPEAPVRKR